MVKDKKLYIFFKTFIIESLGIISEFVSKSKKNVPYIPQKKVKVISETTYTVKTVNVVDWVNLVFVKIKKIKQLDSYKDIIRYTKKHPIIGKQLDSYVGTESQQMLILKEDFILSFLAYLIENSRHGQFNESKFKKLYLKTERWFYSEKIHLDFIAPISNYSMDVDEIKINPSLSIVKLSKLERQSILTRQYNNNTNHRGLISQKFAFKCNYELSKVVSKKYEVNNSTKTHISPNAEKARVEFDTLCSTLRLFKSGQVGYNGIVEIDNLWCFENFLNWSLHKGPTVFSGKQLLINSVDVAKFLNLFRKIEKIYKNNGYQKIKNALSRLNTGYERTYLDDCIVDYFIGFESLFLDDKNPELKYRLSLFVAYWLGKNSIDRNKIFNFVNRSYDIRSVIVHGGHLQDKVKISNHDFTIHECTQKIESYLRRSIKKFIKKTFKENKNESELVELLKVRILN